MPPSRLPSSPLSRSPNPSADDIVQALDALRAPLVRLWGLARFSVFVAVFYMIAEYCGAILMVLCASVLVAVILRGISSWITRFCRLPEWLALAVVLLVLTGGALILLWTTGPEFVTQARRLQDALHTETRQIHDSLDTTYFGHLLLNHVPDTFGGNQQEERGHSVDSDFTGSMTNIVSSTFGSVGTCVVIFVAGIYLAAAPRLYANGVLRLIPAGQRLLARRLMLIAVRTLSAWICGQGFDMLVVGILTGIGLWLAGMPLALPLGVVAGLANFIPYLGALLGFIPAFLVSLSQGPHETLIVVLLYAGIQFFEGYILSPFVQRHAVQMPPALTILSQTIFGALLGVTGFIFAAP